MDLLRRVRNYPLLNNNRAGFSGECSRNGAELLGTNAVDLSDTRKFRLADMPQQEPTTVDEAPAFEHRWNQAKLVLIGLMSLFILAGLAGLFGRGPLSRATVTAPLSQAQVTYERFAARGTPGRISVEFKAPPAPSQATVTLDRPISEHLSVTLTEPHSASESASAEGTTYAFQLMPGSGGKIALSVSPFKSGPVKGAVTVNGERLPIHLMIWP